MYPFLKAAGSSENIDRQADNRLGSAGVIDDQCFVRRATKRWNVCAACAGYLNIRLRSRRIPELIRTIRLGSDNVALKRFIQKRHAECQPRFKKFEGRLAKSRLLTLAPSRSLQQPVP